MKKKEKSIVRIMLQSLGLAILTGILMIMLRAFLTKNNYESVWSTINAILFQDISQEGASGLGIFYVIQTVFLNGLQMTIVPLVFTSLIMAVSSITDLKQLGRIAYKTVLGFFGIYAFGCAFAGVVGMSSVKLGLFKVSESIVRDTGNITEVSNANPMSIITAMVPSNITTAFSSNNAVLAICFLAIVVGLCFNRLGDGTRTLRILIEEVSAIIQICIEFLINKAGPFAIFAMITRAFAVYGIDEIKPVAVYVIVTIISLIIYLFIGYPIVIAVVTRLNPVIFIKKVFKVGLFAFTTVSSAATLPLNVKTNVEELGVSEEVANFTLPLGMTINMNGTAIMHVIGTIFIATVAGFDVGIGDVFLMSMLAIASSAGTPAIPVAGSILLFSVLNGTGFINETSLMIYSLILAINKPVEMVLTSLNVVGDACTALMVANSENQLDKDIYNNKKNYQVVESKTLEAGQ